MKELKRLYNYLKKNENKKILFLTTSNRWEGEKELPKSSIIAEEIRKKINNCNIINVSKLKIFPCEGNVSNHKGNGCGLKDALLKDSKKNPHNAIYESDIIIFFGSIRWGKMNAIYSQLIERLTWLENRHTTLGESNILKDKEVGVVATGQNWNGKDAVKLEKDVLDFFGFKTPSELTFNWQYLSNPNDESKSGYKSAYSDFLKEFNFIESIGESILKFKRYFN